MLFCKVGIIFLTLQVMMKGIFIKIAAVFVLVWYALGIIGFDVHTCNSSGRSFIAMFVDELSCQDIHPEHDCSCEHRGCGCSHHSEGQQIDSQDHCCTDDYRMLSITGAVEDSSRGSDLLFDCDVVGADLTSCQIPSPADHLFLKSRYRTVISCAIWDFQSFYSVWRI